MSCVLRFTAKNFDVDSFLQQSIFEPVEVFKPGDYVQTILNSWITENSGFCVTASDADFNDFKQQILDAGAFIRTYREELLKLSKIPNTVSFFFDFGLTTTLFEEDEWVDCFHFPIEFMRLMCGVGASMEISYYYPTSEGE